MLSNHMQPGCMKTCKHNVNNKSFSIGVAQACKSSQIEKALSTYRQKEGIPASWSSSGNAYGSYLLPAAPGLPGMRKVPSELKLEFKRLKFHLRKSAGGL